MILGFLKRGREWILRHLRFSAYYSFLHLHFKNGYCLIFIGFFISVVSTGISHCIIELIRISNFGLENLYLLLGGTPSFCTLLRPPSDATVHHLSHLVSGATEMTTRTTPTPTTKKNILCSSEAPK